MRTRAQPEADTSSVSLNCTDVTCLHCCCARSSSCKAVTIQRAVRRCRFLVVPAGLNECSSRCRARVPLASARCHSLDFVAASLARRLGAAAAALRSRSGDERSTRVCASLAQSQRVSRRGADMTPKTRGNCYRCTTASRLLLVCLLHTLRYMAAAISGRSVPLCRSVWAALTTAIPPFKEPIIIFPLAPVRRVVDQCVPKIPRHDKRTVADQKDNDHQSAT